MNGSKTLVRDEILDLKTYIPGKPIEEVKRELGIDDIIKLASNENPVGPSPKALAAMQEALASIYLYPDGYAFNLRQALARFLHVGESNLIFGNGADEVIFMLAQTFINPGDEAIIPNPTFGEYETAVKLIGGKPVYVDLTDYTIDLVKVKRAITDQTKMIFICNPNNPTGSYVPGDQLSAFLSEIPPEIIVVLDEAYWEFADQPDFPNSLGYLFLPNNIIIMRTFSKVYGLAGVRVGYAVAKEQLIGYINKVRQPFNVDSVAQAGAVAALADQDHVAKVKQINKEGRDYFYQEFDKMGLDYVPTQANFILVDVAKDAPQVFQELLQKGVIIRPAHIFGLNHHLRVTIGTMEQNKKFIAVLKEVLGK